MTPLWEREWMPNSKLAREQRLREAAQIELQAEVLMCQLLELKCKECRGVLASRRNRWIEIARELRDMRRRMVPAIRRGYILDVRDEEQS